MLIVYNFLQAVLLLCTAPLLALLVASRRKYRARIGQRLGLGLRQRAAAAPSHPDGRRIWLHCLSVGEVTSAVPLLRGLRLHMPTAHLTVSVTTSSGMRVAQQQMAPWADMIIAAPLDLRPVIITFLHVLRPELFILVETDFWPNWLDCLRRRRIPAMLVNGRISRPSGARYQRLRFFFTPLFSAFSLLAMQTENDAAQMRKLQVPAERLLTLGNLKYAPAPSPAQATAPLAKENFNLSADSEVWICGSTHPGEEEILLTAFASLMAEFPRLVLFLAPRDPGRAQELSRLVRQHGLQATLRTCPQESPARILILDTLGELAACYPLARLAFIGGSLVACGGHNPLEASTRGVPVLFGPHMEDFQEIARDLIEGGAAQEVRTKEELSGAARRILADRAVHRDMRAAAAALVARQAGVIDRHLAAVAGLLSPGGD